MVLFGVFGGFLLGYSGCIFDNWFVDCLYKKKLKKKIYLCLLFKIIVIILVNIVLVNCLVWEFEVFVWLIGEWCYFVVVYIYLF